MQDSKFLHLIPAFLFEPELVNIESAFVSFTIFHLCAIYLVSCLHGVKVGRTMVLVWASTMAIMKGRETSGRGEERQKGAAGSSLHSTPSFF